MDGINQLGKGIVVKGSLLIASDIDGSRRREYETKRKTDEHGENRDRADSKSEQDDDGKLSTD